MKFKTDIISFEDDLYYVIGRKNFIDIPESDSFSNWIAKPKCSEIFPQNTSGLKFKNSAGKLSKNSIAYIVRWTSIVGSSVLIELLSFPYASGGWSVEPDNFVKTCIYYTSFLSPDCTFMNSYDQLKIPTNTKPDLLKKFAANSIIFTLFHNKTQTVSVNNIPYNDKLYDMRNQFFWLSPEEVMTIKDLPQVVYNDAKKQLNIDKTQSFVSKVLPKLDKSLLFPEAIEVLELQKELVRLTASKRTATDPKFQLHRYDAGWYQIRMGILNDLLKSNKEDPISKTFIKFKETYKKLKYQLQPMVYELEVLEKETIL